MFNWLFGKKEQIVAKKPISLFSTDCATPINDMKTLEEVIANVFVRTHEQLRPVDADGKPVTSAMDSPTEGNTTALKPLIEPINNVPFVQLQWYAVQTFIGYQIAAIIAQHWLVDKACTMPARDAMRHGYDLTVNDGQQIDEEVFDYINKLDKKKYHIKKNCVELVRFNRIFGIRIALFDIDTNDPTFYEKPFNIDGVKHGSYRGITQIDPYWVTPELDIQSSSNPASINFYNPTWWRVNGRRIHRSHLIVLRNGLVADILKPTYLFGGVSIPQKIAERVYAAERTANEAPMLAATKRTTVWHMDMTQAIANQAAFEQKMQWFAAVRDNFGVKAMGTDDVVEQFDTSLADLDAVIMTQYQLVAAIAEVPSTKLLGTSPKGFNATGEFEADSYHELLESIQTQDMEPLLDRHYTLLMKSEIEPKYGKSFELDIAWNAVDSPSAKEKAEINLIKAQTDEAMANCGAIDGVDIRDRLIKDKDSGYNGISDMPPPDDEVLPDKRNLRLTDEEKEDGADKPVSKE